MVLVRCADIVESIFGYGDTIGMLIFWAILIVQRILRSTARRTLNLLITILVFDVFETKFCERDEARFAGRLGEEICSLLWVCDIDCKRWVKKARLKKRGNGGN